MQDKGSDGKAESGLDKAENGSAVVWEKQEWPVKKNPPPSTSPGGIAASVDSTWRRNNLVSQVNTKPPIVNLRNRLNTDGMRNRHFQENRRLLGGDRQNSWKVHQPVRAHDDNYFDLSILTQTSFSFDRGHQVHIPDEEQDEEVQSIASSNERGYVEFVVDEEHENPIASRVECLLESAPDLPEKPGVERGISGRSGMSSPSSRPGRPWFRWRLFWAYTGPGWLMSIAYLDPGNIESDLQAGGYCGYQLLWVLTVSTLLGFFMQVLAVRLGVVTGRDLAANCQHYYDKSDTYVLYIMMQLAIIGSDIQEIVGSAIAFRVLLGIPLWAGCLLTSLDTITFLALHIIGVRQLEFFFMFLIAAMCFCFFATFFEDPADPVAMLQGFFVPYVHEQASVQAVSILGAVVMPHNIYLHSALVLSRDIDRSRPSKVAEANKYFAIEAALALFVSLLINCAVVAVFAHGFYSDTCQGLTEPLVLRPGDNLVDPPFACVPKVHSSASEMRYTNIECMTESGVKGTCMPIGLQGAALALEAFLGKAASTIWAIGLLAAGQSSTMTGTYSSQFITTNMLQLEIPNWIRVGLTRAISIIPATVVALLANSNYLAADKLDEMLNVLQSLQLPFALFPLLCFTGSVDFMGERFVNGYYMKLLGWGSTATVLLINAYLVYSTVDPEVLGSTGIALAFFAMLCYFYVLGRIAKDAVYPNPDRAAKANYLGSAEEFEPLKSFEDDDEEGGEATDRDTLNWIATDEKNVMDSPSVNSRISYGSMD